ncbi:MAG TPA: hypothetical protein VHE37_12080 [Nevskiaceae bacterium]|nr:hypothetical protein [Nevskiaceae bacterium]
MNVPLNQLYVIIDLKHGVTESELAEAVKLLAAKTHGDINAAYRVVTPPRRTWWERFTQLVTGAPVYALRQVPL